MRRRIVTIVSVLCVFTACTNAPVSCQAPTDIGAGCEVLSDPVMQDGECLMEIRCS